MRKQITWTSVGDAHFGTVDGQLTYHITGQGELLPYGGGEVIQKGPYPQLKNFAELHLTDAQRRGREHPQ